MIIKTLKKITKNEFSTNKETRDNFIKETLEKIPKGARILDAGAGELRNKKLCTHLNYVSQDFCQYDGKGDNAGLQTKSWDTLKIDIIGDITNIPEKDGAFDVILCSEVFEHLPNPIDAIKEFQRLLKKDGILIITAPFCSLTHFSPYHFSTGFNRYFYEHHLKYFGFDIEQISTNGNFFQFLGQEILRMPNVVDTYTSKKASIFDKFIMILTLKVLQRFSKYDKGSDELLCYGYHVVAKKISKNINES